MDKSSWLALIVGAVLLYVLWGLQVNATISIDPDGVKVGGKKPPAPPIVSSTPEVINWSLVDELPMSTLETSCVGRGTPGCETRKTTLVDHRPPPFTGLPEYTRSPGS